MLEAPLQHPDDIVHSEAVQGGLDTLSHQPRVFYFFTETTNKPITFSFQLNLRPQSFPNIIQRCELNLVGVNETKILLERPAINAGHLDDGHRMTID